MKSSPSLEDKIKVGTYLMELGEKTLAAGNPELALRYLWEAISCLCSTFRSATLDPKIQPHLEGYIEKAFVRVKTTKDKLAETRYKIPQIEIKDNGNTALEIDEACAELYKKLGDKYSKEAENDATKHMLSTAVQAYLVQCGLQNQLIAKTGSDKLKKEVVFTLKLYQVF